MLLTLLACACILPLLPLVDCFFNYYFLWTSLTAWQGLLQCPLPLFHLCSCHCHLSTGNVFCHQKTNAWCLVCCRRRGVGGCRLVLHVIRDTAAWCCCCCCCFCFCLCLCHCHHCHYHCRPISTTGVDRQCRSPLTVSVTNNCHQQQSLLSTVVVAVSITAS